MPVYEYTCQACGAEFERSRPVSAYKDPAPCSCGADAPRVMRSMPTVFCGGDPDDVPEERRYRDPRHGEKLSGAQIERRYAKNVERLRRMKADGALKSMDGMALAGQIPTELFYAKRKEDPNYWNNPKNLRKHKEFLI